MATVPADIVVAWPSTAASIPSGWSRVTALDARFVQGAATGGDADLTTDRGNLTHTHTSPAHTPIQNSHQHTVTLGNATAFRLLNGFTATTNTHSHTGSTPAAATATNQSSTVNFGANASNDPPFVKVIWIASDGTPAGVPDGAYAFFASDTLPTGWTRVHGNTYLKGADAAGDGGATGGASTHTHVSDSHTHLQNAHSHAAGAASGNPSTTSTADSEEVQEVASSTHKHTVSINSTTATNQSTTNTTSADNHEPVHKKLNIIENGVGADDLPDQVIALWIGTNAAIPTDWARYTAMDGYFLKGANADGEIGSTGGSQTHTHMATCQPTQNSHTGTGVTSGPDSTVFVTDISGPTQTGRANNASHTHSVTVGATTATNQATQYNVNACSSEAAYPKYRQVLFVQFAAPAVVHAVRRSVRLVSAPRLAVQRVRR